MVLRILLYGLALFVAAVLLMFMVSVVGHLS
jgi:hypothetical protein